MKYLKGYPMDLQDKARVLADRGDLGQVLLARYPEAHPVRTDKALYDYVMTLKGAYIKNGAPISKVAFDGKMQNVAHTLGTHTTISRIQGRSLKTKHEIRVASIFRAAPEAFLKMIVAHELAHLKEKEHNKAFYNLCQRMEPNYYQYEFDLRLYLTHLDGPHARPLWDA